MNDKTLSDTAYEFPCNLCSSTSHRLLFVKKNFPIVKCLSCGLVSTVLPADFDPLSIYDETYFNGGQVDGYGDYESSEIILRAEFRKIVREILKYIPQPEGKKLLELGSAYGYFLSEASAYFTCYGVEVSKAGVQKSEALGLRVFEGALTADVLRETGKVDVVVMLDVIEHLTDPMATLGLAYSALNPGGVMLIVTGDHGSLLSKVMKANWRLMTPPQHTFFFTSKTLPAMVAKAGFTVKSVTAPWKIVPLGLPFYQVGRRTGLRVRALENINNFGIPINLFDTVRVIAVKP
ncbi:MAG TPA: class I SAM-dependent methyltransferase [Bacteroidia bacterium]|nr:class I SAM-dependent methyltransferase [Bacteroidia bacterium]